MDCEARKGCDARCFGCRGGWHVNLNCAGSRFKNNISYDDLSPFTFFEGGCGTIVEPEMVVTLLMIAVNIWCVWFRFLSCWRSNPLAYQLSVVS